MKKSKLFQGLLACALVAVSLSIIPTAFAQTHTSKDLNIYLQDSITGYYIETDLRATINGATTQFTESDIVYNDKVGLEFGYGLDLPTGSISNITRMEASDWLIPTIDPYVIPQGKYTYVNMILKVEPKPSEYVAYYEFGDGHKIEARKVPHAGYVDEYAADHNTNWWTGVDQVYLPHTTPHYNAKNIVTTVSDTDTKGDTLTVSYTNAPDARVNERFIDFSIRPVDKVTGKPLDTLQYRTVFTYSDGTQATYMLDSSPLEHSIRSHTSITGGYDPKPHTVRDLTMVTVYSTGLDGLPSKAPQGYEPQHYPTFIAVPQNVADFTVEIKYDPIVPLTPLEPSIPKEDEGIPLTPLEPSIPKEDGSIPLTPLEPSIPKEDGSIPLIPLEPSIPKDDGSIPLTPLEPNSPKEDNGIPLTPLEPSIPKDDGSIPLTPLEPSIPKDDGSIPLTPLEPNSPKEDGGIPLTPLNPGSHMEEDSSAGAISPDGGPQDKQPNGGPQDKQPNGGPQDKQPDGEKATTLPPTGVPSPIGYSGAMVLAGALLKVLSKKD